MIFRALTTFSQLRGVYYFPTILSHGLLLSRRGFHRKVLWKRKEGIWNNTEEPNRCCETRAGCMDEAITKPDRVSCLAQRRLGRLSKRKVTYNEEDDPSLLYGQKTKRCKGKRDMFQVTGRQAVKEGCEWKLLGQGNYTASLKGSVTGRGRQD